MRGGFGSYLALCVDTHMLHIAEIRDGVPVTVLKILRETPITITDGMTEAPTAHIRIVA